MEEVLQAQETVLSDQEKVSEFVENHRDFFENYVKGKIKFAPAPKGLDTFAFDLKTNTIYVSTRFLDDKGLTFQDEATIFAILHECEHFLEKIQVLANKDGEEFFEVYLRRLEDGAYSYMDNRIADTRENSAIVSKMESFRDFEAVLYKEHLIKSGDFRKEPLHLQLISALSREFHIKDEECLVSDEVREEINKIKAIKSLVGISIIDIMANPNLPMQKRVRLQDQHIWPVVEKLRKKDIENKNKEDDNGDENNGGRGDDKDIDKGEEGDKSGNQSSHKKGKNKNGKQKDKPKETDPNKIFKGDYDKVSKEGMPVSIPLDDLKRVFKDWQKENGKEAKEEKELKEYADKIGVKVEDLKTYRDIIQKLEEAFNKETGDSIRKELIALLERIISNRIKEEQKPRYPLEEGELLIDPVEAVVQVTRGNSSPAVWADIERREEKGQMFGEIEITIVCDRSASMNNPINKMIEQRKSLVFLMEAVKTMNDSLDEADENGSIIKPLKIKLEAYSFQKSNDDKKPFLEMTDNISEKNTIESMVKVSTVSGSTTDFITLNSIREKLTDETKEKIKEGELKKIVIVFTDGGSDDKGEVQKELGLLKESGVIVVGVGITESGKPALETYAPDARLANVAEDLVSVLFELLKEHLKDV
jgi:hypothetical protein